MKVEIEIPEGKKAEWINGVLTLVDDKPRDIIERVKTFDDACKELGENHQYVRAYREWMRISYAECEDVAAYMKLRIITAALNEGWEPTFGVDEFRYYPWFSLYSKDDYEERDEDEKKECWAVCRSNNNSNVNVELVYWYVNYSGLGTNAGIGVHLSLKTKELAEYCAKQFIHIWKEFLLG